MLYDWQIPEKLDAAIGSVGFRAISIVLPAVWLRNKAHLLLLNFGAN